MRTIVHDGFEPVLLPAGFVREGTRRWRRRTGELEHVVQVGKRHRSWGVEWGIVSAELVPLVLGIKPRGDVGDACVFGTPSSIQHPAQADWFWLEEQDVDQIVAGVAQDMRIVEPWLRQFQTRSDLREYLMLNRDRQDPRGFTFPVNLPAKVYVAAALAVVDRAPDASALLNEAATELASFDDEINNGRMARLRDAAAGLTSPA